MGLSHLSIVKSHPDVELVAVCDSADYLLNVLAKYTGVRIYKDYRVLLQEERLDAVVIATPSRYHAEMVEAALDRNLAIFCEKPFCLDVGEGLRLTEIAEKKQIVNQVGYHNRFVGSFHEAKRLLDLNVIGEVHHVRAEAYGPVVLRPKGSTWRSVKSEGGGCLYDYACHVLDLVNYMVGKPETIGGATLNQLFSRDVDDEVYAQLLFANGVSGQVAANWSDQSYRKMYTAVTVWGKSGRITANRQELFVYLREDAAPSSGVERGWNVRYTTDLTEGVWFYVRGEEYSAQIDHFVQAVKNRTIETRSTFRSALETDLVAAAILRSARSGGAPMPVTPETVAVAPAPSPGGRRFWRFARRAGV
jgi:predicted dehydrogenase